jgi:hypothetical protein
MTLLATCDCSTVSLADAVKRRDPTQTGAIRRRFEGDIANRLRVLKKLTRTALVDKDALGFGSLTVAGIGAMQRPPGQQVEAFQEWFWKAVVEVLIGREGAFSWTGQYVRAGYDRGWTRALTLSGTLLRPDHGRADLLVDLAYSELEGIADALYQRAVRNLSEALLRGTGRATEIYVALAGAIDKIGLVRGRALAHTIVVRAHAEATLDGLEAAGVKLVSVEPERVPRIRPHDSLPLSLLRDAKKKKARLPRVAPDEVFPEEVDVLTAGDDKVCPQCESIAENGPYEISEARGLIPAHPNCRCAFIPHFDMRFSHRNLDARPREISLDAWDPTKHPRVAAGSEQGGEFGTVGEESHGKLPPKGKVLAEYTDEDGYTSRIVGGVAKGQEFGIGLRRYATIYIVAPDGDKVRAGYFMNWPDESYGLTEEAWGKLSWEKRATLETRKQATAYRPLREQFKSRKELGDSYVEDKEWDETKHPRVPSGSAAGGEFGTASARILTQNQGSAEKELQDLKKRSMTKPLSDAEVSALEQYLGDDYAEINSALRSSDLSGYSGALANIGEIDSAIHKAVLAEDVVVFRGLGNTMTKKIAEQWDKNKTASFVDKAFVSTSALKDVAKSFSKNIMEIVVRKGSHGLPVPANSEAEILLGRNSRFRVTDVRKSAAGWHVIRAELAA